MYVQCDIFDTTEIHLLHPSISTHHLEILHQKWTHEKQPIMKAWHYFSNPPNRKWSQSQIIAKLIHSECIETLSIQSGRVIPCLPSTSLRYCSIEVLCQLQQESLACLPDISHILIVVQWYHQQVHRQLLQSYSEDVMHDTECKQSHGYVCSLHPEIGLMFTNEMDILSLPQ